MQAPAQASPTTLRPGKGRRPSAPRPGFTVRSVSDAQAVLELDRRRSPRHRLARRKRALPCPRPGPPRPGPGCRCCRRRCPPEAVMVNEVVEGTLLSVTEPGATPTAQRAGRRRAADGRRRLGARPRRWATNATTNGALPVPPGSGLGPCSARERRRRGARHGDGQADVAAYQPPLFPLNSTGRGVTL